VYQSKIQIKVIWNIRILMNMKF